MEMQVRFNGRTRTVQYNNQSGYYEIELSVDTGGIYQAEANFTDLFGNNSEESKTIQVFAEQNTIKIDTNKVFMWIFDYNDFSVKDIAEISDYEINIDEETNANSIINVLKKTDAKARDIIAVKKNNEVIYWGIIENIQNEDGQQLYEYTTKYITNLFNQTIALENENIIKTVGVEDFIARTISKHFINNTDTFLNLEYLRLEVKTHTRKQTTVSNVENGIYNLHTWITNCTQNYDIVYSFSIVDNYLVMTIENNRYSKELIDVNAQPISNYAEVFETNVVSKVIVLTSTNSYTLYLLNGRTTTTNMNDENRAEGRVETVYTEDYEDAQQKALDTMKENSYNHNITFDYYDKFFKLGTPIAIKTKESIIYDTYISAIQITPNKFVKYQCGNIRINFIEKILKERKN